MKLCLTLVVLGAGLFAARRFGFTCCCSEGEAAVAPHGSYVEVRSASVFAGACHYGSELVTAGREAVLAWKFEGGSFCGQELAGVELVAALASNENLAQPGAHRSVIYVDTDASEAVSTAAVKWLRETLHDALGEVVAVEAVPIELALDGEHYTLRVATALALEGSALPDRACCAMPLDVWYTPYQTLEARLVGNSTRFEWSEKRLAPHFERSEQNDAFLGRFGSSSGTPTCANREQPGE